MAKRNDKKREAARIMRQQKEREERRRQLIMGGSIVAVVVLILGIVGVALYMNQTEQVVEPQAQHTESAIIEGDGPVTVDVYEDFMCPICKEFHTNVNEDLQRMVEQGHITLNVHPIAILDRASQGTRYSTRSASAAVCAADEDRFAQYTAELFANQPPEGTPGLDDDALTKLGTDMGMGDSFSSCIEDKTYRGWVQQATETAADHGVTGTPTIFVNGTRVEAAPNQGIEGVISQFRGDLATALEAAGVDPSATASTDDPASESEEPAPNQDSPTGEDTTQD